MNEIDVLERIEELCRARSWTYYRLAKESGIPYSTLNTMLRKTHVPTVPSLTKICDGFGITLSQFFSRENEIAKLTKPQNDCLEHWDKLDEHSQEHALAFMDGLSAKQNSK